IFTEFMRLGAFFSLPLVVLAIAPSQIAATFQPTATSTLTKPLIAVQLGRTYRIRFQPGASGATVERAVIRGERDTFLLAARRRQTMTVSITSLEKNAVFDIKDPNGKILKQEVTNWSGVLPATGDYQIVVGGTRGNASYRLRVSVR
ncbi:MAG: hypothetical protein WA828_19310, partial [Coleofasciculaceae cyanobacterium]